ncbi:probable cytochrome P450 6g2 isoform X2 [Toxorhynchites rutilus septentrionalis]|uniref:probable cytochrome P450 6g2 isoform X2 n=1 Tax=Toxorhynchites rutilus septentrionalis TaxID=329112 RepID=UPI002479CCE6|nr:probable cytochrome P450 6g2 isoform X2 [Toxorhynchites rutilus septentrionalis]
MLLLIITVIAVLMYYGWNRHNFWNEHGVSYILEIPIVGNFSSVPLQVHSMFDYIEHIYNHARTKDADFFGVNIFFRKALVIRSPVMIKKLLAEDATYFLNRQMCTDSSSDLFGYYNLLMIKEPLWKDLRAKLSPEVTSFKLKRMQPLIEQIGKDMLDHLSCLPEKRPQVREVEFKELCARFTTDVIASTFFGIQANCLMDEQSEFRYYGRKIFEYGPKRGFTMATFFFLPELVPYLKLKLFPRDTEEFLKTIIQQEIFRREKNGETRGDFIDSMISLKRSNAFIGTNDRILLKDDILVAQAATFYMASFETTSSVLSFTLYELTKNPNIQKRLREEIRSSIQKYGSDLPYECLINEMPYLGMVISEAARLYPVLPFIERQCTLPVGVSGYKLEPFSDFVIPNRMPVLVPIYAIHRDPKFFPDPLRFNPERFAKENLDNIVPCSYMPFGVGPRTCLGSHFGTLQVKVAVVRILSTYRIGRSESTPEKLTYRKNAFTLQSNEGLSANLILDEL